MPYNSRFNFLKLNDLTKGIINKKHYPGFYIVFIYLLDDIVVLLVPLLGIQTPYVYHGSAGSIFGFHVEDQNLLSINIQHSGAPKIWFGVTKSNYQILLEYFR